jgi:hypothetical protein
MSIDVKLIIPKCTKTSHHARANYNYLTSKSNIRSENISIVSPTSSGNKSNNAEVIVIPSNTSDYDGQS